MYKIEIIQSKQEDYYGTKNDSSISSSTVDSFPRHFTYSYKSEREKFASNLHPTWKL